jgi:hypothetical protein
MRYSEDTAIGEYEREITGRRLGIRAMGLDQGDFGGRMVRAGLDALDRQWQDTVLSEELVSYSRNWGLEVVSDMV